MPRIAPVTAAVPQSLIRRIHNLGLSLDRPYIRLHVGEPSQPIAPHIAAAAKATWDRDETNYTHNGGIQALREAAADWISGFGRPILPEQVWAMNGATEAIYQAIGLVIEPGDEVLVPDPGYTTFTMSTMYHAGVPVPYPLQAGNGFRWDIEALDRLVTPRTRAIIVNSPSNPLGTVLTLSEAQAILDWARRRDLWIVSDEVYERFVWGVPHVSLTALDDPSAPRVLGAFSLSKTHAMTGIRIGFLVTPTGWGDTMGAIQEAVISSLNVPAQYAAIAAITGPQDHVAVARAAYQEHLAAAREVLDAKGYRYLSADGAFYLWIDVSPVAPDGDDLPWCDAFLLEQGVAIAPGSAFGAQGRGWIRVCYAGERAELVAGLSRLPDCAAGSTN